MLHVSSLVPSCLPHASLGHGLLRLVVYAPPISMRVVDQISNGEKKSLKDTYIFELLEFRVGFIRGLIRSGLQ